MIEDYNHLLQRILFQVTGKDLEPSDIRMENGGCINMALSVTTERGVFFIKWNELAYEDMFEKEAEGLALLSGTEAISVPEVIGFGQVEEKSFLVLEHIQETYPSRLYWQDLGRSLATLHGVTANNCGLGHNNYIGRLHQTNTSRPSWIDFYKEMRLSHQLGLAMYNDYVDKAFVRDFKTFLEKLERIIPESKSCLLHGDLWNGNIMPMDDKAYVFDPAVYYGAPEMDLAMTRLFGGFDEVFYQAYHEVNPIPDHFEELLDVYNLYPLMVHVNLFGPNSGYLGSVKRIIKRYL